MRHGQSHPLHCSDIRSFTCAQQKNVARAKATPGEAGESRAWTAPESDSKLIVSWLAGARDNEHEIEFKDDLRARLGNRVQLATDGHKPYLEEVEGEFVGDVDRAMPVTMYGAKDAGTDTARCCSRVECTSIIKRRVEGNPDPAAISTSHVERHNLAMQMHMRRYARLATACSKKFQNCMHMVVLHTAWCNFIRIRKSPRATPAAAAGLSDIARDLADLVRIMDGCAPKLGPRDHCQRQNSNRCTAGAGC